MSAYTIVEGIEQGSADWLDLRKKYITATDATKIMNESPWDTPLSLWEKKMGIRQETASNSFMERGNRLEPIARDWFEQKMGIGFPPAVILSNKYAFMMSSLDGLSACGRYALEIKNVNAEDHSTALKGYVPKKYIAQTQHHIENLYADVEYYVSFNEFNPDASAIVEVFRDNKYIDLMLEKEREFFRCMQQFVPPAFHEDDYRQINDSQWQITARKYLDTKKELMALETSEKALRNQLIALAGGSNAKGAGIELSKVMRKGNIDYDTILNQYKIDADLEQFRKPEIETWRIKESA
jgi:putative phage-type endonuclease